MKQSGNSVHIVRVDGFPTIVIIIDQDDHYLTQLMIN